MKKADKNGELKNEISDVIILLGLTVILFALLIPLFIMAKYSFVQGDDVYYMNFAGKIWHESHSVVKTILFETKQSLELWKNWQGLYFVDWLYLVLMAFFGEKMFAATAYLGIAVLLISDAYFAWTVFHRIAKVDVVKSFIAIIPICIFQISIPTVASEAFYWMVGMVLYVFSFALGMIMISEIAKYISSEYNRKKTIMHAVAIGLLSVLMAGSNYVVALPILTTMTTAVVFLFIKDRKKAWILLIVLITYILFFGLNVFSPGASVRMNSEGTGYPALKSVIFSFSEAFKYLIGMITPSFVLLNLSLIPLFLKMNKNTEIRFKYPWLLNISCFCIFASMFTPNLYGLGMIGVYRVQNLYRFVCFIGVPVNIWYWLGFIQNKMKKKNENASRKENADKKKVFFFGLARVLYAACVSVTVLFVLYKTYGKTMSSVSAYYSIKSNEAKTFYAEWEQRQAVLEDVTITDPVFEPYTVGPYLIYITDISTDENHYVNRSLAEYYGKKSVRVKGE